MIRHHDASVGIGASEYDVAPFLPIDDKSDSQKYLDELPA
jgi:hypothetical protein